MDEYIQIAPDVTESLAAVTGKPEEAGGIAGRREAAGLGFYYALKAFLSETGLTETLGINTELTERKIIVQGFGNVGYHICKFLTEKGKSKIIGVIDKKSGVYNENGLDIEELKKYQIINYRVGGFPGGKSIENTDEILSMECDIFIPAATERTINSNNVHLLKCKIVAEGANLPVTLEAEDYLKKNGVVILPDIIMNSGAVISSFFEYVKNIGHISPGKLTKRWELRSNEAILRFIANLMDTDFSTDELTVASDLDIVNNALEDLMQVSVKRTQETSKTYMISYKDAAYVNALNRIYENMRYSSYYAA